MIPEADPGFELRSGGGVGVFFLLALPAFYLSKEQVSVAGCFGTLVLQLIRRSRVQGLHRVTSPVPELSFLPAPYMG